MATLKEKIAALRADFKTEGRMPEKQEEFIEILDEIDNYLLELDARIKVLEANSPKPNSKKHKK